MTGLKKRIENLERHTSDGEQTLLVLWGMPENTMAATCDGHTVSRLIGESEKEFEQRVFDEFERLKFSAGIHWISWQ